MSAPRVLERRNGALSWYAAEHLERAGVSHGFTTRSGGASRGAFMSLNFSSREGDVPARVVENWRRLEEAARLPAGGWALLSQVHGARVERAVAGGPRCHHRRSHPAADALATGARGVALGVLTADCLPVVLSVPDGSAVAIAHAGWRGTLAGVAAEALRELCAISGAEPREVLAALGPSIGVCCLQVGVEVHASFLARWGAAHARRVLEKSDPWRLDLQGANLIQLREAGVRPGATAVVRLCTCCRKDLFFSYRRDGSRSGRMLNFVAASAGRGHAGAGGCRTMPAGGSGGEGAGGGR